MISSTQRRTGTRSDRDMFIRIWQFRVASDKADEFREVYGPEGAWAALFRRETGFLGTELLQSATHPNVFLTIDSWDSPEAWAAFLRTWGDDYVVLDRRCEDLVVAKSEIGTFKSSSTIADVAPAFRQRPRR
jgi:quinol monooxygenase YgiN